MSKNVKIACSLGLSNTPFAYNFLKINSLPSSSYQLIDNAYIGFLFWLGIHFCEFFVKKSESLFHIEYLVRIREHESQQIVEDPLQ